MQFSSRLPIAVHVLLCIHTFDGTEKLTSDFLAGSVNVNPVIIRNTLGKLKAAGLVTVDAGIGGAHLNKEPKDISLLDIFLAVEEEEALFRFHANPNPACPVGRNIHKILDGHLQDAQRALEQELAKTTLADIQQETLACLAKDAAADQQG